MTQAAAPSPHLVLTGANPSPPGQPQEQTPVDDPQAEVEIKPQLKPRAVRLRKKTQNLPISCTSCKLSPHNQLGTLCVYGIYKRPLRAPTKENTLVLIAVDIGHKTQWSRTRLESELPHSRSRDQHSVGGHPREVRWTVTPSKRKD